MVGKEIKDEKMGLKCNWSASDISRDRLGRMWVLELSHGKMLRKRKLNGKVESLGQMWAASLRNVLALGFQPDNLIKGLVGSQGVWLKPRGLGYA